MYTAKYTIDDNNPAFLKYKESVEADLANFPRVFARNFANWSPDQKTKWFKQRYLCCRYPLFLAGFVEADKVGDSDLPPEYVPIMGMDFQPEPHELLFKQFVPMRPGEGFVLADLDSEIKKRMILWPRGVYKTSAVRVIIVQLILNYPNVRICFLTGGDSLAVRQLKAVKSYFERPTLRFRLLFPEFCTHSVRNRKVKEQVDEDGNVIDNPAAWTDELATLGTAHEFVVPCRTNQTFVEPTFAISTAKSVKAGAHFDFIFIDDLVNDQNYQSVPALEKCFQDYLQICPLLDPTGFIVMTGTCYSFGDTYERIQESAKNEEKQLGTTIWRFSIRSCWSWGCQNCEHTDVYHDYRKNITEPPCTKCACVGFKSSGVKGVLFPEARTWDKRPIGHTLKFLEGEKIRVGDEFFANQYENQPIATGSQVFTETLIGGQTFHDMNAVPKDAQSFTIIVGDLAYVGATGRDYSVLFACRVSRGQIFVYDCDFGNWDSAQVAEHTIRFMMVHHPTTMYFEKINGSDAFDHQINAYATQLGIPKVPLQWEKYPHTPNAKIMRIGSVKGPLVQRRLWFYANMRGYEQLVQQLVKWPKLGKHDDFADCVGMVIAAPTGYHMVATPNESESATNWLRQFSQGPPPDDSYYDNGAGTGVCCGFVTFGLFFPFIGGILTCLSMSSSVLRL